MNIGAGEGLQDVLKSNLGPSGTLKMYVSTGVILRDNGADKKLGWWTVQAEYVDGILSEIKGMVSDGNTKQIKLTKDGNVLLREMVSFFVFSSHLFWTSANRYSKSKIRRP